MQDLALPKIGSQSTKQSAMMRALVRLLVLTCLGSLVIVASLPLADSVRSGKTWSYATLEKAALAVFIAVVSTLWFYCLVMRFAYFIDANAAAQAQFLAGLNPKCVDLAIPFSASLSLFLKLAIIRWQSTAFLTGGGAPRIGLRSGGETGG